MKRCVIVLILLLLRQVLYAQDQPTRDIFIIGSSSVIPNDHRGIYDGFGRISIPMRTWHKDQPISFWLESSTINAQVWFSHSNYKNKQMPDLYTFDCPITELQEYSVEIIETDDFFNGKTREDVWRWALYNERYANVWVIDRSLFYKSDASLPEPDRMKIIQVRIITDIIPEGFRNAYYAEMAQ